MDRELDQKPDPEMLKQLDFLLEYEVAEDDSVESVEFFENMDELEEQDSEEEAP